jgi:hypothetical protein
MAKRLFQKAIVESGGGRGALSAEQVTDGQTKGELFAPSGAHAAQARNA